MPREAQDITEAEMAVLQELWRKPQMSVRQLAERLYPRRTAVHYGTVQKQLERLEAKGFVRRDRSLFVHLFTAAFDRDAIVGRRVDAMVDKLCGGSLTPIISHLLRNKKLSTEERQKLRAIAESAENDDPKRS
jgi:BlaI family transcriptional regulator, penicillinase repressor